MASAALRGVMHRAVVVSRSTSWRRASVDSHRASREHRRYCRDLIAKHDHSNFVGTLLAPAETIDAAFAIRAFNVEISQIKDSTREQTAAEMRHQFWSDIIDIVCEGRPPPQHPVALCLADACHRHSIVPDLLREIIAARRADINRRGFASLKELVAFSDATAGALLKLLVRFVFSCHSPFSFV